MTLATKKPTLRRKSSAIQRTSSGRTMGGSRISGRQILENVDMMTNQSRSPSSIPYNVMRPIIDTKTKNKSFIRVHRQLKLLGVENNSFFLILLNPALQGVDPYDPNLTPQQALMIVDECRLNIFYFLREVVRIPEQGAGTIPFRLDRGTLAALYCFYNNINFYLMKPRQTGKSVGICAMLAWAFKFGVTNGQFFFSANNDKNVKENLRKMKQYISLLPSYLAKMGTVKVGDDGRKERKRDNITAYYEPISGNTARIANRAMSEEAAEEIGRGDSHTFEFYDEAEFTPYIDTIVKVSGMAFNTASSNAIANGGHACRIFASTPGELADAKRCGRAMKLVEDALPWDEKFYDVDIDEFKQMIATKSKFKIVYIEYDYKSLGYGEKWFRNSCTQVGHDQAKIRREILLERFAGSNMSPFSREDLTEIAENVKKPEFKIEIGPAKLYEILFYKKREEIKKNRVYIIAIDPSDGNGNDNYAMCIIDPYTLHTVAEFKSPYMAPQGLIDLLEYLVTKFFPKAIISIESNRNGSTLIHFFDNHWLKPHLYSLATPNQDTNLIHDNLDDKGFVIQQITSNKYFGIKTTPTSRDMMMSLLVDAVHFRKDLLNTQMVVEDIKDLVLKNNKIQADTGKHDDMIMAWCIAMYTYYYGERLERYGLYKNRLPDDIAVDDDFLKLQSLYQNPEIRKQFPTMYNFYVNELQKKMEQEYNEKIAKKMQNNVDTQIGSIKNMISKVDDNYVDDRPDEVQIDMWRAQMKEKWKNMNAVREKPARRLY